MRDDNFSTHLNITEVQTTDSNTGRNFRKYREYKISQLFSLNLNLKPLNSNNVTSSLAVIQMPGHRADNCKLVYADKNCFCEKYTYITDLQNKLKVWLNMNKKSCLQTTRIDGLTYIFVPRACMGTDRKY